MAVFPAGKEPFDNKAALLRSVEKLEACVKRFYKIGKIPIAGANLFLQVKRRLGWSIKTEEGVNLLDPKKDPLIFLTLLTSVIWAFREHGDLLRTPAFSLGEEPVNYLFCPVELTAILQKLIHLDVENIMQRDKIKQDLLHLSNPTLSQKERLQWDEDHILISSLGIDSFSICMMNAAVSDGLQLILDEIEGAISQNPSFDQAVLSVIQKHLIESKTVWNEEPLQTNTLPFASFLKAASRRCLQGIIEEGQLDMYQTFYLERYATSIQHRIKEIFDLMRHKIGPAVSGTLLEQASHVMKDLQTLQEQIADLGWEAQSKALFELGLPKLQHLKSIVDRLE